MALAIQSASNTSLAVTVSATFTSAPQQDNLLIAVVTASVGVGSISLSNSGWSTGTSIAVGAAGGMVVFYKVSAAGGADTTVTANATLAAFMDIQIFEYPQITNESPLDLTASTADSGSGVTSRASGTTGTLTQANEIAFVAVATDSTNGGGASWTNSFNTELTTTHLITGDISVTATTALSSTASWTTSARAAGVILTFFGEIGDSYALKTPLKPTVPVINWNNPLTKGLVFDTPLFEKGGNPQDVINKGKGTVTGATFETNLFGPDLDFSAASSQIVYTTSSVVNSLVQISIEMFFYYRGKGGSSGDVNFGRFFSKGPGNGRFMIYNNDGNVSSSFDFWAGHTTTSGLWNTGSNATGRWYHLIFTYDGSAINNVPLCYLNGVSTALTQFLTPVGSLKTDDTNLYIGNYSPGTGNTDGKISYTRIWNRILNAQEAKQLYTNPWQIYTQPGLLTNLR